MDVPKRRALGRCRHAVLRVVFVLAAAVSGGCAVLALPALGTAALSAGAGSVVKAGTEYTMGGAAYRTFGTPLEDVHEKVLATLGRLGVKVNEEERDEDGGITIRGAAYQRRVLARLEPVTPKMTRLKLVVRQGLGLSKDRATTSEIIVQTELALDAVPSAGIRAPPPPL